jgi:hypothetical protein
MRILLLLALFIFLKPILKQVTHRWAALQSQPISPIDEPLSQPNHHHWFNFYFWDAATNYGQHAQARVYAHRT